MGKGCVLEGVSVCEVSMHAVSTSSERIWVMVIVLGWVSCARVLVSAPTAKAQTVHGSSWTAFGTHFKLTAPVTSRAMADSSSVSSLQVPQQFRNVVVSTRL